MPEFNLLEEAGIVQIKKRIGIRITTSEERSTAKKQGFDYYDGDRKFGFGGFYYDWRWQKVAELIKQRYNLNKDSKVLIERDEKGFIMFDLKKLIPGITVYATHVSDYPINHAMDGYGKWALINNIEKDKDPKIIEKQAKNEIIPFFIKADSRELPFKDNYFDTVISINEILIYPEIECRKAVKEIVRVSKENGKNCYIHVDSWKNEHQKQALMNWTLLSKIFLDVEQWKKLFEQENYFGDWGFVIIE